MPSPAQHPIAKLHPSSGVDTVGAESKKDLGGICYSMTTFPNMI